MPSSLTRLSWLSLALLRASVCCVCVLCCCLLAVLDFFTTRWQTSSSLERLMEEVALPQQMPEVD